MAAACRDLSCSYGHLQGRGQQSCHCLCCARRKGSCLLALCSLPLPQLTPSSPCIFLLFPLGFLALFSSSLEILLPVSIDPCEASCVLDTQLLPVHVSSSKLTPAIFIPSSGGSFPTFYSCLPTVASETRARLSGEGPQGNGRSGRCGCGRRGWTRAVCQGHAVALRQRCQPSPGLCPDPVLCPHPRRCSCTAASWCAGRWTRPRAAPRAAADARAGRPGSGRSSRTRNPFTWQTTS